MLSDTDLNQRSPKKGIEINILRDTVHLIILFCV
jgi:hypothetical protein